MTRWRSDVLRNYFVQHRPVGQTQHGADRGEGRDFVGRPSVKERERDRRHVRAGHRDNAPSSPEQTSADRTGGREVLRSTGNDERHEDRLPHVRQGDQ